MFKLKANPTFRCKVNIPVPGEQAAPVEFQFAHKRRGELREFLAQAAKRDDVDVLGEIIVSWSGMEDETGAAVAYSREALARLVDEFPAAAAAITGAYVTELADARLGN